MSDNQDLISVTLKEFKNLTIAKITEEIQNSSSSSKHFVVKYLSMKDDLVSITTKLNEKSGSSWECSSPTKTNDNKYEGWIWSGDIKTKPIKQEKSIAGDVKNELYLEDHKLYLSTIAPYKVQKPYPLSDKIRIASWNSKELNEKKADKIKGFVRNFIIEKNISIIAIQEIIGKEADKAITTIVNLLNRHDGEESKDAWNYKISENLGIMHQNRQEKNAFIWNSSLNIKEQECKPCSKKFIDPDQEMKFKEYSRSPFYGVFEVSGQKVILVSVHVVWGGSDKNAKKRRRDEVKSLPKTVEAISGNVENIFILGDFNLEPNDEGFKEMKKYGYKRVLDETKKTNVVDSDPKGTKSYDNIWYRSSNRFKLDGAEVIREEFEKPPSDHCPIWAEILTKNNKPEVVEDTNLT